MNNNRKSFNKRWNSKKSIEYLPVFNRSLIVTQMETLQSRLNVFVLNMIKQRIINTDSDMMIALTKEKAQQIKLDIECTSFQWNKMRNWN